MKYSIIATILLLSFSLKSIAQKPFPKGDISFMDGSALLLKDYKSNTEQLASIDKWIKEYYYSNDPTSGYVRIVAYYTEDTPEAVNKASIQASTFASYLRRTSGDKNFRYTFYLQRANFTNRLHIECFQGAIPNGENTQILYTNNEAWINKTIASYPSCTFLNKQISLTQATTNGLSNRAIIPSMKKDPVRIVDTDVREIDIEIYYRFDKIKFDTTYLSNPSTIRLIDSIMQLRSARYIDSLRIIGHASPEGPLAHNQWLSENRAKAMKEYLVKRYPDLISTKTVITQAGGENWDGFRRMAAKDTRMPMKEKVMTILSDSTINDTQRQRRIEYLDNGNLYKRYLLPRYYRYLRSGASLLFLYDPKMPTDINLSPPLLSLKSIPPIPDTLNLSRLLTMRPLPTSEPTVRYIRPIAFKSNLLGDLTTLFNFEIEMPIGRHFSLMAEWNFPFWGGLGNAGGVAPLPMYSEDYTLQMLAGGLEARYWFPRSAGLDKRAWTWKDYNPLTGWFVGLYGGAGLYDFQWQQHGMQGEFFLNAGLTGGFAHPIAKHFHMEYSLGIGYLQTQYYNYTMRDGHKVVDIRDDGKYDRRQQSYLGPTKLKVSIVWIPQFRLKGKSIEKTNTVIEEQ